MNETTNYSTVYTGYVKSTKQIDLIKIIKKVNSKGEPIEYNYKFLKDSFCCDKLYAVTKKYKNEITKDYTAQYERMKIKINDKFEWITNCPFCDTKIIVRISTSETFFNSLDLNRLKYILSKDLKFINKLIENL